MFVSLASLSLDAIFSVSTQRHLDYIVDLNHSVAFSHPVSMASKSMKSVLGNLTVQLLRLSHKRVSYAVTSHENLMCQAFKTEKGEKKLLQRKQTIVKPVSEQAIRVFFVALGG